MASINGISIDALMLRDLVQEKRTFCDVMYKGQIICVLKEERSESFKYLPEFPVPLIENDDLKSSLMDYGKQTIWSNLDIENGSTVDLFFSLVLLDLFVLADYEVVFTQKCSNNKYLIVGETAEGAKELEILEEDEAVNSTERREKYIRVQIYSSLADFNVEYGSIEF